MLHPFGRVTDYALVVDITVVVGNPNALARIFANFGVFLFKQRLCELELAHVDLEAHAEVMWRRTHSYVDVLRGSYGMKELLVSAREYALITLKLGAIADEIQDLRRQIADAQTMISACDRCEDRCICGYTMSWCPWVSGVSIPWPQYKANACSSGRCDGRGGVVAEANVKVTSSS